MDFELPTTKEELKTVLAELFDYYHHYKGEYEGQPLEVLELDKLTFTEKSESAWRTELSALLDKREAAESAEKCAPHRAEYEKYLALYEADDTKKQEDLLSAEEEYEKKLARLRAEAAERNIGQSSAYLNLLAALESEYEEKRDKIGRESAARKAEYARAMALAEFNVEETQNCVAKKYEAELETAVAEALREQREYVDAALKYNNTVEEKLVKSRNDKAKAESALKLQYLEITARGVTDEELLELGYYTDVIRAVDGYYYTVPAAAAYDDFVADPDMPIYLGSFYNEILYKYQLRKNNES